MRRWILGALVSLVAAAQAEPAARGGRGRSGGAPRRERRQRAGRPARRAGRVRAARRARRGHRATGGAWRGADPRRPRLAPAAHRLHAVRDQRRDARARRAPPDVRPGRAALRHDERGDRAELPAARHAGRLALARRGGAEPGGDRRARGPCPGLVAGRERLRDGGSRAVRTVVLGLVAMALVLAGCGAFFRPRPTGVEATRSPVEEAPLPPAPEPPKLVEQLTRLASELSELQNVVAELDALVGAAPSGGKVPDALLKIGLCQRSLGDGALAKRTWERLVRDFPESVAARQARVLLRS